MDYGPTPRVRKAVDELKCCVLQPLAEAQSDAGLGPDDGLHLRLDDSAAGSGRGLGLWSGLVGAIVGVDVARPRRFDPVIKTDAGRAADDG